jgi:hypothetical protein
MGGSLLEPQEELQRTDQEIWDPPRGKEEDRRGKLREKQRPGKEGRLRKLESGGGSLGFFHVRSREESASPLPRDSRAARQP